MPAADVDQLLTVKQVASKLGFECDKSVYRLVYAGELPVVPVGTGTKKPRIRIKAAAVQAFIDRRAAKAA